MSDIVRNDDAGRLRFLLAWVAPVLVLLGFVIAPLASGERTLFQRDVMNTHYGKKFAQAEAMLAGELPMVDLQRAGGQVHVGNPNTVPLYPTNLLLYVAEPLWMINAHFWLHWLAALVGGFWLGRALGQSREAAWTLGVVYALSGYFLSTLNLFNLVAAAALLPALLAAAVEMERRHTRRRAFVALVVLWVLMILGGDPVTAAIAFFGVVAVVLYRHRRRYPWGAAALAIGLGTLIAAPQWVELLRIVGFSYRGFWGYGDDLATFGGWRPVDALDLLIPLPFGPPNVNYWGHHLHVNHVPLFLTYYPGLLAIALATAARKSGDRSFGWAWWLVGGGLFFALGETNPIVVAVSRLPGASLLRIPAKLWCLVALGLAVLASLAASTLSDPVGRRRFRRSLAVLATLVGAGWLVLTVLPSLAETWLGRLIPEGAGEEFVERERLRWAGLCLINLLALGLAFVGLGATRRRPALFGALLLVLHTASQIFFLVPVLETDERRFYLERPPLLDEIPPGSRVVYAEVFNLFGPTRIEAREFPGGSFLWRQRALYQDLAPWSGVKGDLHYEFDVSPEGLDSFLTRATAGTLVNADSDLDRMRILEASGVEFLLIKRPLDERVLDRVELVTTRPTPGTELHVYRLLRSARWLEVPGASNGSDNLSDALATILDEEFDPSRHVVLAGEHELRVGAPGTARELSRRGAALEIEVEAPDPAVLVVQRTHLPIYKVEVDGEPASFFAANLHRLGIKVPAGRHRVTIDIDRRPFHLSLLASAVGLVALILFVWKGPMPLAAGEPSAPAG